MKFFFLILLLTCFLSSQDLTAQEIRARVLDAGTREPVPFANVLVAQNKGVVTNEEGYFAFVAGETDLPQIKISSLGYEVLEIEPGNIRNGMIFLKPATIELGEVFLSDRHLTAEEIFRKALQEVTNNYNLDLSKKRIFFRESNSNLVRQFDLHVDKSTIPGIDQRLMNSLGNEIPKNSDSYKEVLAELYGNYEGQKLRIIKAANLDDPGTNQTLDQLTEHLEMLFRQNLKEKSYLKIRSGIVGVKVNSEELQKGLAENSSAKIEKTAEELKKENEEAKKRLEKATASNINTLLGGMFWKKDITFDLFEQPEKYRLEIAGYAHLNDETLYIIAFKPKKRADYKGRLYISTLDYGIHRIEYSNVKPLKKFSLFGISTSDDVYRGKIFFVKDGHQKYRLNYVEQETGETIAIKRPLTIIEKNKHVRGRRKQNELDLDIRLKMSQLQKLQLLVFEDEILQQQEFQTLPENGFFEYRTFKSYNPDFWQGNNIIEPNTAIKKFTAPEKD